jgi:hypothetical protein
MYWILSEYIACFLFLQNTTKNLPHLMFSRVPSVQYFTRSYQPECRYLFKFTLNFREEFGENWGGCYFIMLSRSQDRSPCSVGLCCAVTGQFAFAVRSMLTTSSIKILWTNLVVVRLSYALLLTRIFPIQFSEDFPWSTGFEVLLGVNLKIIVL